MKLLTYWEYYLLTYLLTCLNTYLLTPWSRVRPEKLTGSQLVKKFPIFYGTRRFITSVTSTRHLSLSWARSIQSMPPRPTSWRSVLILFSRLDMGLQSCAFPQFSPPKPYIHLYSPRTCYITRPSHLDLITRTILGYTLRNNPEERSSDLLRGGSLKSRILID